MFFYTSYTFAIYIISVFGIFFVRTHIIIVLMCLEMILLAANLNFLIASLFVDNLLGQVYALIILSIAASESAIGLALLIVYYRLRGGISISLLNLLKG